MSLDPKLLDEDEFSGGFALCSQHDHRNISPTKGFNRAVLVQPLYALDGHRRIGSLSQVTMDTDHLAVVCGRSSAITRRSSYDTGSSTAYRRRGTGEFQFETIDLN